MGGANVATIILMLIVGYSGCSNPEDFPMMSNLGLVFPIFLVINFCFLVFWLLCKPRGALIPLVGFLLTYQPTRTTIPFNVPHDAPDGALKVLSYNVWMFAWGNSEADRRAIPAYIATQKADIVCLQESYTAPEIQQQVDSLLNPVYAYRDTICNKLEGNVLTVYSHFPILRKERIRFQSDNNLAGAFFLDVKGRRVMVVNAHLEGTTLDDDDKREVGSIMSGGVKTDSVEAASRRMLDKLNEASARRAPQAETVARYISKYESTPVILCGDFNDGPLSYAHRTLNRHLLDCYVSTANGPGFSYNRRGFFVRIDNILCSHDWTPYACRVDRSISTSDHYPIYCWLQLKN